MNLYMQDNKYLLNGIGTMDAKHDKNNTTTFTKGRVHEPIHS